jgi:acetaldehyde dehydrogenase (acetylating)
MEVKTLHSMTTELNGRTVNPALESYLPRYAGEVAVLLAAARAVADKFPAELAPASVFTLKPGTPTK